MARASRDPAQPSDDAVDAFFQNLEARAAFPEAALAELVPEGVLTEWRQIGDTQSEPAANAAAKAAAKARLRKLAAVSLRLGTGSLEGIGLKMATNEERTAAAGFLVEGTQFLQWLQAEFGINRAIATQLWERMSWQRDVVNQQRAFSMTYPFLGVCGALHLEDVWPLHANPDPLGLRGRLCFFYTRPSMKRAIQIEAANRALGNLPGSNRLEERLVDRFYHIYRAHDVQTRGEAAFAYHLDYPFLNYTFVDDDAGAAKACFVENFDQHVKLQEELYLVQHEESKRHGKLKGKHLRHALNWHNLLASFQGHAPEAWPTGIALPAMRAAALLGEHCEAVASELRATISQTARGDKPDAGPPAADAALRTHAARIARLRALPFPDFLAGITAVHKPIVLAFAATVLQMLTVWLDSTCLRSHSKLRDAAPDDNDDRLSLAWETLIFLEKLQLMACVLSTNPNGAKKLFAVTRPLDPAAAWHASQVALLDALQVPRADHSAPSPEAVVNERPNSAPVLSFVAFDIDLAATHLDLLTAWTAG
ncbi:unnamed protein product [Symbiodinium sp. CCMP2456]|nr:unnamed protein product [Symbiodinium sp. CCMP2456]